MLPATKSRRWSLADVLPSCLSAMAGEENTLGLRPVDRAVVLLVDGLGAVPLRARSGHCRVLAPRLGAPTTIAAGFPTTTASALATLTTGELPGVHGLVGYTVLDAAHDRIVNELSGWDDRLDPATWQRVPTLFERATDAGIPSFVVGPERYRSSGFTRAVLRGARYRAAQSIAERLDEARHVLDTEPRCLLYVYVPELDQAAHARGWQSQEWTAALEEVDAAVGRFAGTLGPREGLLVTADHGVLDVPPTSHVLVDTDPGLVDGVRFLAGEPRCLQLHLEPGADAAALLERWRRSEESRSTVLSRAEAIAAGWFGPRVDAEVVPRIGDILVAARKGIAYYDGRTASASSRAMVGQHGSLSPEETAIPLLPFGAFA